MSLGSLDSLSSAGDQQFLVLLVSFGMLLDVALLGRLGTPALVGDLVAGPVRGPSLLESGHSTHEGPGLCRASTSRASLTAVGSAYPPVGVGAERRPPPPSPAPHQPDARLRRPRPGPRRRASAPGGREPPVRPDGRRLPPTTSPDPVGLGFLSLAAPARCGERHVRPPVHRPPARRSHPPALPIAHESVRRGHGVRWIDRRSTGAPAR